MPARAKQFEELVPLVDLCRAGKLFEVQDWIQSGKPVNPPEGHYKGSRKKVPIEYAIDMGFHSLVQVLLQGGADLQPTDGFCPMRMALEKRRFDLVQLLVQFGYDASLVNAQTVLATWDPKIMEYFIEAGCDFETDHPLAWALCNRIRTALPLVKKHSERFPSFPEQANIALRYHCREGNAKWVSLLLWAGADPWSPGEACYYADVDPEDGGLSAIGFAALYSHYELFELPKIRSRLVCPEMAKLLSYLSGEPGIAILESLLQRGLDPNDQENGGCSAIQHEIGRLALYGNSSRHFDFDFDFRYRGSSDKGLDSSRSRDCMKIIHLLARAGGKWIPEDDYQLKSARRSLLKMIPEFTVELVWILVKYQSASREDVQNLVRTPSMKKHLSKKGSQVSELIDRLPATCQEGDVPASLSESAQP